MAMFINVYFGQTSFKLLGHLIFY